MPNKSLVQSHRFADLPDSDVACDACGYCLRGITLDGRCPECGLSVAQLAARVADRVSATLTLTGAGSQRRASDLRWGPWLILGAGLALVGLNLAPIDSTWSMIRACGWIAISILTTAGYLVSLRSPPNTRQSFGIRVTASTARVAVIIFLVAAIIAPIQLPMESWLAEPFYVVKRYAAIWSSVVATIAYFTYACGVTWAGRNRSTFVSCIVTIVVLLLGATTTILSVGLNDLTFPFSAFLNANVSVLPLPGFGWIQANLPQYTFLWSRRRSLPAYAEPTLIAQFCCVCLTLLQLALMTRNRREDETVAA